MEKSTVPFKDEKGQGLVEYAMVLMLASVAGVAALTAFGGQVATLFRDVTSVWP